MRNIQRVLAIYFSATGTTKTLARTMAEVLSSQLSLPTDQYEYTLPTARTAPPEARGTDLVVWGVPVYAGRVPNVLVKYMRTFQGNGAYAIPVVLYGNRAYNNALYELTDIAEADGFRIAAACAFIGQHSFSETLAKGRPDEEDLLQVSTFSRQIVEKLRSDGPLHRPDVPGDANYAEIGYRKPKAQSDGRALAFVAVKPETLEGCTNCGLCARLCPMDSISPEDCRQIPGICIKCNACVKACPQHAKVFLAEDYVTHKTDLEHLWMRRAVPELFL